MLDPLSRCCYAIKLAFVQYLIYFKFTLNSICSCTNSAIYLKFTCKKQIHDQYSSQIPWVFKHILKDHESCIFLFITIFYHSVYLQFLKLRISQIFNKSIKSMNYILECCPLGQKRWSLLKTLKNTQAFWHENRVNKINFKYSWSLHYFSKSSAAVGLTLGTPEFPQHQKARSLNSFVFS